MFNILIYFKAMSIHYINENISTNRNRKNGHLESCKKTDLLGELSGEDRGKSTGYTAGDII